MDNIKSELAKAALGGLWLLVTTAGLASAFSGTNSSFSELGECSIFGEIYGQADQQSASLSISSPQDRRLAGGAEWFGNSIWNSNEAVTADFLEKCGVVDVANVVQWGAEYLVHCYPVSSVGEQANQNSRTFQGGRSLSSVGKGSNLTPTHAAKEVGVLQGLGDLRPANVFCTYTERHVVR